MTMKNLTNERESFPKKTLTLMGSPESQTVQRYRRALSLLMAGTALSGVAPAFAQSVGQVALPQNGQVISGQVSISAPSNDTLTITQDSQKAIVNWDSFSIGQGGWVDVVQQNTNSALLNRVTGDVTSTIAGTLSATGQVYLVNPNGIFITSSGVVEAGGGFVASTLDISDSDFLGGNLHFSGTGDGLVSNAGAITVGTGGYAAFLGGRVSNTGTVNVALGKIGIGAAASATLDIGGDGFLQVELPSQAEGDEALIEAAGQLAGARIEVRAVDVANAIRNAVNVPGELVASGAHAEGGKVIIDGGAGAVQLSGRIDASSDTASGGEIAVGGESITLRGAFLDVDGTSGGTITVGGDWHGGARPGLTTASTLNVDEASLIEASGTAHGGGSVVLWADGATNFSGTITARGVQGNGGQAEVSGREFLAYHGLTDLLSDFGRTGDLLLDPYYLTISTQPRWKRLSLAPTLLFPRVLLALRLVQLRLQIQSVGTLTQHSH